MPNPDRRLAAERRLDDLLAIYRHAQRAIVSQIRAALASDDLRRAALRRAQLAAVLATMDQLQAETDPMARAIIDQAFIEQAQRTSRAIIGLRIDAPEIPGAFAGVHRQAVETLQDSILGRLDTARRTVGRQVADIYAREQRRTAVMSILGAEGSPRAAAASLQTRLLADRTIREMARQGGVGFIDRAGKRWQLDTYAEMATRTVVREAAVEGAKARMAAHGIALARVSVHPEPCKICAPWQGRLVSLDGTTTDYEAEAVTDLGSLPNGGPPMHPRCKHSLQPVATRIEAIQRELAGTA